MKKRLTAFFLTLCVFTVNLNFNISYAKVDKISNEVKEEMEKSEFTAVIVNLKKQGAVNFSDEQGLTKIQKKHMVYKNLVETSAKEQKEVLRYLKEEEKKGNVFEIKSFFIVNSIAFRGKKTTIEKLKHFSEVKSVVLDETVKRNFAVEEKGARLFSLNADDRFQLDSIKVESAWNKGITGKDVVIGFVDSAPDFKNLRVREKFRGYNPSTQELNFEGNFKSFVSGLDLEKVKDFNHCTVLIDIAMGGEVEDVNNNLKIAGVSPSAKWICAVSFNDGFGKMSDILKGAEWMLAPDDDPDLAPDIVNISWGTLDKNDEWFQYVHDAYIASGICPFYAAGNENSGIAPEGSIDAPANYLNAFAIGSIKRDYNITNFSKRGPSPFDVTGKIIKPDVAVLGDEILTIGRNGNIGYSNGTSFSCALVSGVGALLLSANPNMSPDEIYGLLRNTASPLTDVKHTNSPNMAYGYGIVNVDRAIQEALKSFRIKRLYGIDRMKTAVALSQNYNDSEVENVYIVNGSRYSDCIAIASHSGSGKGSILLTDNFNLPDFVIDEIKRIKPKNVYIVGGSAVISDKVENQLKSEGYTPKRIFGVNRYETAVKIGEKVLKKTGGKEIFLANGISQVDALSISSVSSKDQTPILLSEKNGLGKETLKFIDDYKITKIRILGGPKAISEKVETEIRKKGITIDRIYGNDRYETAVKINENYYPAANHIFVANGIKVVDALAVSLYAGELSSPIILVDDNIDDKTINYIKSAKPKKGVAVGGKRVIKKYITTGLNVILNSIN